MKYRVERATQEMADLMDEGMPKARAEAQAARKYGLSDNERADMRVLYQMMTMENDDG